MATSDEIRALKKAFLGNVDHQLLREVADLLEEKLTRNPTLDYGTVQMRGDAASFRHHGHLYEVRGTFFGSITIYKDGRKVGTIDGSGSVFNLANEAFRLLGGSTEPGFYT